MASNNFLELRDGLLVALAINAATITLTEQDKVEHIKECIKDLQ